MRYLISSFFLMVSGAVFSQSILNAKSAEEFRKAREEQQQKIAADPELRRQPAEYAYIDEKDILRSMVVWEIIDLNEKINQPLFAQKDNLVAQNKSLYQALLDGIRAGRITEVYDDEMFKKKLTSDEIQKKLQRVVIADFLIDKINAGETITEQDRLEGTDYYETKSQDVKLIKIKGMWYIDRRDGELRYRLLGIAPMGRDPQTLGTAFANDELIDIFWVFYPDAREELANSFVFNPKNMMAQVSYDDLLNARKFNSVIYKSDNKIS
ncbi:MAG: gliding motility protein GldN, partial [Chryseobacterium sp.]